MLSRFWLASLRNDAEMLDRVSVKHEDICRVQEDQHARGRRTAELVKGIRGFYVRYGSGLDNFDILARVGTQLDGTLEDAIAWGKHWAKQNPKNREFIARKDLLT